MDPYSSPYVTTILTWFQFFSFPAVRALGFSLKGSCFGFGLEGSVGLWDLIFIVSVL